MPTIAILGGEGRLGRFLTEFFADCGFTVFSLDSVRRNSDSELVRFIECDLADPGALLESAQLLLEFTGKIDHCVTALRYRGVCDSDYDSMTTEFKVAVAGPHAWIETIRAAQPPHFLQSVVHISSVLAKSASLQESAAYHSAKGALESLVRWEALAWGKSGTSVNAIAPAYIDYRAMQKNSANTKPGSLPFLNDALNITHALEQPPSPLAICRLTKFVLESDGISGQVIPIDSGSSILEPLGVAIQGAQSREA